MQPSEFLNKPYYYFEMILNNIKEIQDSEEKDKNEQEKHNTYNTSKIANNMMGNMTPTMPKMNLPKF